MHRPATLLAVVLALTAPLGRSEGAVEAQTPKQAADSAPRAITKLEDAWATALVKRDGATFQRLLAANFIYTENDRLMKRDDVIRDVVSGTDTVRAARNESMDVHMFGTTAIATGWLIVSGRGAGGPFEHRYRFTDTWVKGGNGWQIVAAQDYLAPGKGR